MNKPLERWEVLPHGKLTEVDENILTVTGEIHMPMKFPRRMTVVRLRDSNLVVFSAIALDEDEMHALEAYGQPAYLVVPNDHHRLDAKIWKQRYPNMQVELQPLAIALLLQRLPWTRKLLNAVLEHRHGVGEHELPQRRRHELLQAPAAQLVELRRCLRRAAQQSVRPPQTYSTRRLPGLVLDCAAVFQAARTVRE